MKSHYFPLADVSRALELAPSRVQSWIVECSLPVRELVQGSPEVAALPLVHLLLRKGIAVPGGLSTSIHLLVVDDEPAMLRTTARLLRRSAPHLRVSLAEGFRAGLREISELKPDIVLLDMHMPESNGLDLCRRIKSMPERADTLVIAFSGRRDAELESEFRKAGARGLLDKPPDVQQLLELIEGEVALCSA